MHRREDCLWRLPMATTVLPVAATSTPWPEPAILTGQPHCRKFSQAHESQKVHSRGSAHLHKKSLPRLSGDSTISGIGPKEAGLWKEGAGRGDWLFWEILQFRRDVKQSTIGYYEDAYRGKGTWVMFGKAPS